jgi:hypothetical protein
MPTHALYSGLLESPLVSGLSRPALSAFVVMLATVATTRAGVNSATTETGLRPHQGREVPRGLFGVGSIQRHERDVEDVPHPPDVPLDADPKDQRRRFASRRLEIASSTKGHPTRRLPVTSAKCSAIRPNSSFVKLESSSLTFFDQAGADRPTAAAALAAVSLHATRISSTRRAINAAS